MAADPETIQAVESRGQKARALANEMRSFLKEERGPIDSYFFFDRDTPVSVLYQALRMVYGDGLGVLLREENICLFQNDPYVYLHTAPTQR